MMNRRQRLLASLRGDAVDRPPVCFYEINGHDEQPDDPDPFNIYSHSSWEPLLRLAREESDRILLRGVPFVDTEDDELSAITTWESDLRDGSRYSCQCISASGRRWQRRLRLDPDVRTTWTLQHFIEDEEDLEAWLELPAPRCTGRPDISDVLATEKTIGDSGLVALDTPDPLCMAAELFDMGTFTIAALTEPKLFRRLLDRYAAFLYPKIEAIAAALPGRLWRIVGPEYACPPYLPPQLFRDYVCAYDQQIVDIIQRSGGYARLHCHGKIGANLPDIAAMGIDAIDPLEPPPQGDVDLRAVREQYGDHICIFGNLEISDIENCSEDQMRRIVGETLDAVDQTSGRGFVLMPSSAPYGRVLPEKTSRNYQAIVEMVCGVGV